MAIFQCPQCKGVFQLAADTVGVTHCLRCRARIFVPLSLTGPPDYLLHGWERFLFGLKILLFACSSFLLVSPLLFLDLVFLEVIEKMTSEAASQSAVKGSGLVGAFIVVLCLIFIALTIVFLLSTIVLQCMGMIYCGRLPEESGQQRLLTTGAIASLVPPIGAMLFLVAMWNLAQQFRNRFLAAMVLAFGIGCAAATACGLLAVGIIPEGKVVIAESFCAFIFVMTIWMMILIGALRNTILRTVNNPMWEADMLEGADISAEIK